MKLFIVLVLVAAASTRPDNGQYVSKYENFNVDELIQNDRLLKAYAHCFIDEPGAKCTPEGNDIKKWIPEATQTTCAKCSEKQKPLIAKTIKAIKDKLPAEYKALTEKHDPDSKYIDALEKFLNDYGN